jgi:hypothetical protein
MFNLSANDIQKRLSNSISSSFSPTDIEVCNMNFPVSASTLPLTKLVAFWYPRVGYEVISPQVRESYKKWITGVRNIKNTIH